MFDLFFWGFFIFLVIVIVVLGGRGGLRVLSKVRSATSTMTSGIPSVAIIESVAETGVTITSPWTGPDAAVFRLSLAVTPPGGGQPYQVQADQSVPRVARPMVVPGARVGVLVDPSNPMHVDVNWQDLGGMQAANVAPPGGFTMSFDPSGRPTGDLNSLVTGVHGGTVNTIRGSADQLLATGTHGTAEITTAQPLGRTVRDINPNANPARLDYPMWLFTVEVTLPGQAPFPAIFGHFVPTHRVGVVAPGVKLAVAVNEADRHEDVAIDWDRSPLPPGV